MALRNEDLFIALVCFFCAGLFYGGVIIVLVSGSVT